MKKGEVKSTQPKKKRIADEILFQVGRSVLLVFLVVAVVAILMVRWIIVSSKESELTLQSLSASHQLTGFFEQYASGSAQLAVNPEIKSVLLETTPGKTLSEAEKMETVRQNLINVQKADAENILAAWIADLDTSSLTQSDGYTSGDDWKITERVWYDACVQTGTTVLTEPYVDPATEKIILSAVTPVFDDSTGEMIGVTGLDVSMEHLTEVMGKYKIGNNGYVFLVTSEGTVIYHPQEDMKQKNIADADVSQNVADAVKAGKEQFLKYKAGGTTKYGVAEPVGDLGYIVISNMPFSEYYALLIRMIIILVVLFVAGIVLIVLSIRQSAASLSKPIMELNHTAQQLAERDLDVLLEITSEDEIGELGKGFAVVADEIGKLALESSKAASMTRELIGVSMEEINKGNDIANGVMSSLEKSVDAVDKVNEMIRKTAESAALQADNVKQIRIGIDNIAQGVNDNSAVSEETYATSEQLATQTVSLNDMVQKFELKD